MQRATLRKVIWVVGVALLIPPLILLDTHRRASNVLEETAARDEKEWLRLQAPISGLPPLWDPPLAGDSWSCLDPVLRRFESEGPQYFPRFRDHPGSPGEKEAILQRVLNGLTPFVDAARPAFNSSIRSTARPSESLAWENPASRLADVLCEGTEWLHGFGRERTGCEWAITSVCILQEAASMTDLPGDSYAWFVFQRALSDHSLGPEDCRHLCQLLDRMEARRSSAESKIKAQAILVRRRIEEVRRRCSSWTDLQAFDPTRRDTSWVDRSRFAFSLNLAFASAITMLNVNEAQILESLQEGRPNPKGTYDQGGKISDQIYDHPVLRLVGEAGLFYKVSNHWPSVRSAFFARLSLALAWYQAEKGTYPKRLENLAPGYFEKALRDPVTGDDVRYVDRGHEALVSGPAGPQCEPVTWVVRRRR